MDDDVPPYEALNSSRTEIIQGLLACSLATDILIREANDEDAISQSGYSPSMILFVKWLNVPTVRKCHESTLRVLVNLSHDNETWSGALLNNELTVPMVARFIVSSHHRITGARSHEDKMHISDRLCLALGLLTNLVQMDERAKNLIRETCTSGGPVMFLHSKLTPPQCLVALVQKGEVVFNLVTAQTEPRPSRLSYPSSLIIGTTNQNTRQMTQTTRWSLSSRAIPPSSLGCLCETTYRIRRRSSTCSRATLTNRS